MDQEALRIPPSNATAKTAPSRQPMRHMSAVSESSTGYDFKVIACHDQQED